MINSLAIKWGDAKDNPVKEVDFLEEPPGRTRFLIVEEAKKLIELSSERFKPVIITALNTGMRRSELLSLKWSQIHIHGMNEPYIEIVQSKNNKKRSIPLNADMVNLFKDLKKQRRESDYVFLNYRGEPLKFIDNQFRNVLKKADIEDFRFHDLRHTFASHYIMSGGDILSLKEILGHSDLKMVERYSHLTSAYKHKMMSNLNGKFSLSQKSATYMPPGKKPSNFSTEKIVKTFSVN